jgi:uncharacterized protein
MNKNLTKYIEEKIFPEYSKNEEGHGISHIKTVIERSKKLSVNLDVNQDIVYTVAAFHDIGHHIDRKNHEKVSAEIFYQNEEMKKFFTEDERTIIKEAIEDHRSTLQGEPRSVYGKIVSSADRTILDIDDALKRAYLYGKKHFPEYTEEESRIRVREHYIKKYGIKGYAKTFIKDEEYDVALEKFRELLDNEGEFCERLNNVIKLISKS